MTINLFAYLLIFLILKLLINFFKKNVDDFLLKFLYTCKLQSLSMCVFVVFF